LQFKTKKPTLTEKVHSQSQRMTLVTAGVRTQWPKAATCGGDRLAAVTQVAAQILYE